MKLTSLFLPDFYIKALDELCSKDVYPNRAVAIRVAVRDLLVKERSKKSNLPNEVCCTCGRRV